MTVLEVVHETRYRYAAAVTQAQHLAYLTPLQDERQHLLEHELQIDLELGTRWGVVREVRAQATARDVLRPALDRLATDVERHRRFVRVARMLPVLSHSPKASPCRRGQASFP